ncbi:F-box protein CPR1-like [Salvia hispanica]|uniref:F-box protein CPR1-like n=1 Tax=Salvia hispanica TaxID=49212 RepID=UPI002008F8B7|nr:F-box protein CPR1-like [Salvia hispanica]
MASLKLEHIYTLGTGTWRRVEAGAVSGCRFCLGGHIECNGNLHWILYDPKEPLRICGFDIETECFSIFSALMGVGELELIVLKDCLCISYKRENEIVIWLMKEYRVKESWTIEYKMSALCFGFYWKPNFDCEFFFVKRLIYVYNKTRTTIQVGRYEDAAAVYYLAYATISIPSLFSIRSLQCKVLLVRA